MLKDLMKKLDSIQNQTDSREMSTIRKNQVEMLRETYSLTVMKNALKKAISRLDTAKEKMMELENKTIEIL